MASQRAPGPSARKALEGVGGEVAMNFRIPGPIIDDALAELGVE
jgi:hypothetical protein